MELEEAYDAIRAEGAELVAVSVDDIDAARRMMTHVDARFPILADPSHRAASAYGIFDLLDDGVAAPATYVIGHDEVLGFSVGQNIADRVPASAIIELLQEQKTRKSGIAS